MSEDGATEILITHYLWMIVSPILIIFGTLGNITCVAMMCRRNLRAFNASVYLIALAIADTCVLYTGLLRHFVREAADTDLRDNSDLSCRINSWMVYVSLDTSVWILVAFTFERILSVFVPHKVKTYCTRLSSILVITAIVVLMMAINGHILYGSVEESVHDGNRSAHFCGYVSSEYRQFFEDVFPWIDFSIFNCVPFVILITGNSCIAVKVLQSRRKTRKVAALEITQHHTLSSKNTSAKRGVITPRKMNKTSSMTAVLLLLNCVFLITTTPVSVYFILLPRLEHKTSFRDVAVLNLAYAVVNLIMYINNSINFVLYCLTGSRFRKEFVNIFKGKRNWVLERPMRTGPDEELSRKSPPAVRQIPATQTSEVPYTVTPLPEMGGLNINSLTIVTDKRSVHFISAVPPHKDTVSDTLQVTAHTDTVTHTIS